MSELHLRDLPLDAALKETNACYDRIVAAMRIGDRKERAKQLKRIQDESDLRKREFGDTFMAKLRDDKTQPDDRAQMLGELTRLLIVPVEIKIQQAADKVEQQHHNLQIAIALELYRHTHKKYPDKLPELSPNYLQVIPKDMYTSQDLIYRKNDKGYLLYSVGPNGKDDGGRTREDDPACDDIVIRMPLPTLKADDK